MGAQAITSVTHGELGLVGVGADESGGDPDAAVWTSPDGITWSRAPHDEAVFGGEGLQDMKSVITGGPGLVAVGSSESDENPSAAVWTSSDGITWSRVPHDEAVFGGEDSQEMTSVTAGGPGLVAVGSDASGGVPDGAVWTSPDGITWSRVPHDEVVFGGERFQTMNSVTTGGPGLVAVGSDGPPLGPDAAVWVLARKVSSSEAQRHFEAGLELQGKENLEQAIVEYDEAIRLDPQFALGYAHRGWTYAQLDQNQQAFQDFDEAIRLDPELAPAYLFRGSVYAGLGQYHQAIQDFDQAIRVDLLYTNAYVPRANAFLLRGGIYDELGQYERAIADLDEAIRLDPEYAIAYFARGDAYDQLGKESEAREDFERARELGLVPP